MIGDNKLRLDFGTTASVVINLIWASRRNGWRSSRKANPTAEPDLCSAVGSGSQTCQGHCRDGSGIVRLEFTAGKLKVSARGDDQEISSTIDTLTPRGTGKNRSRPRNTFSATSTESRESSSSPNITDVGPVVFEYQKSPRVLIMPMSVQWGMRRRL